MNSFLEELEKKYELFEITNGEIIEFFEFPSDVYETWRSLLAQANSKYFTKMSGIGEKYSQIR